MHNLSLNGYVKKLRKYISSSMASENSSTPRYQNSTNKAGY